jgi:hypothetical protein
VASDTQVYGNLISTRVQWDAACPIYAPSVQFGPASDFVDNNVAFGSTWVAHNPDASPSLEKPV